jgi:hypothetical protein
MRCKALMAGAAMAALLAAGQDARAASGNAPADQTGGAKPAVSALNGKVDYLGGSLDGNSTTLYEGSVALPLGQHFGFQADAVGSNVSGAVVEGFGAHAFWRDPDIGLVGAVISRTGFNTVWGNLVGGEAEAYFGPITVAVNGGWQNGEFLHTGWGNADLRAYPTDDLMLVVGTGIYNVEHTGQVGIEWRPGLVAAVPGLALFGDAGMGERNYEHAIAGIRIYFGEGDKPLVRRHREDDPMPVLMGGVTNAVGPSGSRATGTSSGGSHFGGSSGSGAGSGGAGA